MRIGVFERETGDPQRFGKELDTFRSAEGLDELFYVGTITTPKRLFFERFDFHKLRGHVTSWELACDRIAMLRSCNVKLVGSVSNPNYMYEGLHEYLASNVACFSLENFLSTGGAGVFVLANPDVQTPWSAQRQERTGENRKFLLEIYPNHGHVGVRVKEGDVYRHAWTTYRRGSTPELFELDRTRKYRVHPCKALVIYDSVERTVELLSFPTRAK